MAAMGRGCHRPCWSRRAKMSLAFVDLFAFAGSKEEREREREREREGRSMRTAKKCFPRRGFVPSIPQYALTE
jgi:hypothetical protein